MTDEAALLAAVLANRDEDMPRLAYADWLDEHGQNARAEFIRVQCELARAKRTCPGPDLCRFKRCEYCDLRGRERELILAHETDWFPPFGIEKLYLIACANERTAVHPQEGDCIGIVRRGFINESRLSWTDWVAHNAAILKAHPIERVKCTTFPGINEMIGQTSLTMRLVKLRWPEIEFELPQERNRIPGPPNPPRPAMPREVG